VAAAECAALVENLALNAVNVPLNSVCGSQPLVSAGRQ
jgi:hypothetical protein